MRARRDEGFYKGRFPIMRPINHAWISQSKLSEKMGALQKVDATETHRSENDLERISYEWT